MRRRVRCRFLLVPDREFVGPEDVTAREAPEEGPCEFACEGGYCARRDPLPEESIAACEMWTRCGGPDRRFLPRAGGIDDQRARDVWLLDTIDATLAAERARREAAAANAPKPPGVPA